MCGHLRFLSSLATSGTQIAVSGFNCEEEDVFDFEVNGNLNGDAQLLWTFENGSPEVANSCAWRVF